VTSHYGESCRASCQMFVIQSGASFPDARKAFEATLGKWQHAIEKTAELVVRLSTTREAETAAAAHFAVASLARMLDRKPTEREVSRGCYALESQTAALLARRR
jgi:hypothetical protein